MSSAVAEPETAVNDNHSRSESFEAIPFSPSLERHKIVSKLIWSICEHENIFTDYERACPDVCRDCDQCKRCFDNVSRMLGKIDTLTWECWRFDDGVPVDLVGVIYLTKIRYGCDAVAHYLFFDGRLKGKTRLMQDVIEWCFTDHPRWKALQRLTVEVPRHAFALLRHAQKRLGFGGPYKYEHKGNEYDVEGIRRHSILWRGEAEDVIVMGLLREEAA